MSDDATKPSDVPEIAPGEPPAAPRMALQRADVIHSQRAWGGRMTVEEAWADGLPLEAKCDGCAAPRKMVRLWIRSYMPLPDFHRTFGPVGVMLHCQKFEGRLPILDTIHGPMVYVRRAFACSTCAESAEKAAAQHPSWMLIEIRRPPKNRPQVAVPRGPRA